MKEFFDMRTFIKSCFSMAAASLLLISTQTVMAGSSKDKDKDDPVKKCQAACVSNKGNEAYEACMLQCKETHKNTGPAVPTIKK